MVWLIRIGIMKPGKGNDFGNQLLKDKTMYHYYCAKGIGTSHLIIRVRKEIQYPLEVARKLACETLKTVNCATRRATVDDMAESLRWIGDVTEV